MLEELGVAYNVKSISLAKNEQKVAHDVATWCTVFHTA